MGRSAAFDFPVGGHPLADRLEDTKTKEPEHRKVCLIQTVNLNAAFEC
jgi:hypothetical protein